MGGLGVALAGGAANAAGGGVVVASEGVVVLRVVLYYLMPTAMEKQIKTMFDVIQKMCAAQGNKGSANRFLAPLTF